MVSALRVLDVLLWLVRRHPKIGGHRLSETDTAHPRRRGFQTKTPSSVGAGRTFTHLRHFAASRPPLR